MMKKRVAAAALVALLAAQGGFARAAEPIVLKFGFPPAPNTWINTTGITPWAERVGERTGGAIQVQVFGGGSVVNFRNVYDRVLNSVVDIGYSALGEACQACVRSGVSNLPFEADNPLDVSRALWRLVEDGTIAEDFVRVKPLAVFGLPGGTLHSKTPVTKLEDLKGMKLIAGGRQTAAAATALGAVPVTLTNAEAYQAIERGLAQAIFLSSVGVYTFKLEEVTKYHLDVPLGIAAAAFFMNKESFAKLPDAVKATFEATTGAPLSEAMGQSAEEQEAQARAKIQAAGGEYKKLIPAEVPLWKERLDSAVAEWVRATPDGDKVLAAFRAELAKARAQRS